MYSYFAFLYNQDRWAVKLEIVLELSRVVKVRLYGWRGLVTCFVIKPSIANSLFTTKNERFFCTLKNRVI